MWNYSWEEAVFVIFCLRSWEQAVFIIFCLSCRSFHTKELFDNFFDILSVGEDKADGTITLIKGPTNILVETGGPSDRERLLSGQHVYKVLFDSTYNLREGEKGGRTDRQTDRQTDRGYKDITNTGNLSGLYREQLLNNDNIMLYLRMTGGFCTHEPLVDTLDTICISHHQPV